MNSVEGFLRIIRADGGWGCLLQPDALATFANVVLSGFANVFVGNTVYLDGCYFSLTTVHVQNWKSQVK